MSAGKVSPQQILTPYVLYFAFAAACFIYGGLILSGLLDPAQEAQPPLTDLPVPMIAVFAAVAVCSATAALLVGRALDPRKETDPLRFLRRLQARLIVQAAFMESIAILGLAGCFLGLTRVENLLLVGAGLIGLLVLFPGLQSGIDDLKALLRRQQESA